MNTNALATDFMLTLVVIGIVIMLYLLPWFIGKSRDMHGCKMLLLVNLLFGWTTIGWVVCMLWGIFGQTNDMRAAMSRIAAGRSRR